MKRLTCREVILDHLEEYVDGVLARELLEDFERHLALCPACLAYLNTYRRTRQLAGHLRPLAMPVHTKTRLQQFLLERLTG